MQWNNLNKIWKSIGSSTKQQVKIAVLLDEKELALARGDFYFIEIIDTRLRHLKESTRPEVVKSGTTTASDIVPDS